MTFDEFIEICAKHFKLIYKGERGDYYIFWHRDKEENKTKINSQYLDTLLQETKSDKIIGETEIYNEQYFEIPIKTTISQKFLSKTKDENNQITYSISKPSDKYILYYLSKIKDIDPSELALTRTRNSDEEMRGYSLDLQFGERITQIDFFLEIKLLMSSKFETLVIQSENPMKASKLENLAYSFLFHLSYNAAKSVLPIKLFSEIVPKRLFLRLNLKENHTESYNIGFPKRKYNNDLVLYYQRAISSLNIDNKYLSFYHIIEHFFEQIYHQDIVESIKFELTKPSFNHKRDTDINQLIKVIKNRLIYRRESFVHSEREALVLTLKKFIPELEYIKDELNEQDSTLLEYYSHHNISFSASKNEINFINNNYDNIIKKIANRIYDTRNAIVHSKESEHLKYLPFKNDNELAKEIPLIKIIAEKIIIGSSTEL